MSKQTIKRLVKASNAFTQAKSHLQFSKRLWTKVIVSQ